MTRYVSWLVNVALGVVLCLLVANTANAVFAAWLAPETGLEVAGPSQQAPVAAKRSWQDRQAILARNLFNASLLAPPAPAVSEVVEEDLEETRLPIKLLGTLASPDPKLARAAVEDQEERKHLILQVNDEIKGKAKLVRIERRRIVLSENGTLRELTFDEFTAASSSSSRSPRRTASRATPTRRQSRRTAATASTRRAPSEAVDEAIRNPADLFSKARILPKWENGRMVGVQVSGIKEGSIFEELGIENGEVITQLNGIQIDSPEASAQVVMEFSGAEQFEVTVDGPGGSRTLSMPAP